MGEQLGKLRDTSLELHAFLQKIAQLDRRSGTKAHLHAITLGRRDEKELAGILDRLDRTGSELQTRIQLVLVGMLSTLHDELVTPQPVLCRSDTDAQGVLAPDQSTDTPSGRDTSEHVLCSQTRSPSGSDGGLEADVRTPGRASLSPSGSQRLYLENVSLDEAHMINGDVGSTTWTQLATGEYRGNEAKGHSLQVNGRMDSESFNALLAARR